MDPDPYMHHMDIFSHYSLCFFLFLFLPKRHYHPLKGNKQLPVGKSGWKLNQQRNSKELNSSVGGQSLLYYTIPKELNYKYN